MEISLYTCSNLKFICFSKTYLPDRNTRENPVQIEIKIESTLKCGLILLKKPKLLKGTM